MQSIITLRSGRQVDNQVVEPKTDPARQEGEESGNKEEKDAKPSIATSIIKDPPRLFVPKAPYPERLQDPKKRGKFEDILEVFKQVQINIPFLDAIQQVICQVLEGLDYCEEEDKCPKEGISDRGG